MVLVIKDVYVQKAPLQAVHYLVQKDFFVLKARVEQQFSRFLAHKDIFALYHQVNLQYALPVHSVLQVQLILLVYPVALFQQAQYRYYLMLSD